MTTHLRPTGAERREPDGGRSRTYDICVNGRPVGSVELATDPRLGPAAGRVRSLAVDEPQRRRGRGTVAALAAEEVLRGWGCRRVEANVPAAATAGLRLATALGYVADGRFMAKELAPGAPPELPAGSTVRPLTDAEFPAWRAAQEAQYVHSWGGRWPTRADAERRASADHDALLPDGAATDGMALLVLEHAGVRVGTLWARLSPHRPEQPAGGYVITVEVAPEHRGRGHGRTLMLAAERECLAAGLTSLALYVFTDNPPALALYESLGYETTEWKLHKQLL